MNTQKKFSKNLQTIGFRYGQEAIRRLALWAVLNIDFDHAVYPVVRANIASRKIPKSLGGVISGEKRTLSMGGEFPDEVAYKIPYEVLKHRLTQ
jgi:hypothetical protein